ncbi:unnamed protein product [Mycena citricolor]|uniref:F-box domain-containing protein n=1 Tax=Mycena citricolor TaxID=2018698 RepID=A0AAD2HA35_9AGAR|nr:unnamed protein product [Mycena citricolor]
MSAATQAINSTLSLAERRAAINASIAWHYSQIADLKAQVNDLNPVNKLHDDVLRRIFHEVAFMDGEPARLSWAQAMYVCRRWHRLLLVDQVLWGHIRLDVSSYRPRRDRLKNQLRLSGGAPLFLHVQSFSEERLAWVSELLSEHAGRLRELVLRVPLSNSLEVLGALRADALLLMRRLHVDALKSIADEATTKVVIPTAFFDGRVPALTDLNLRKIDVDWSSLRGLTHLHLSDLTDQPFSTLLSVLVACPAMVTLHLDVRFIDGAGDQPLVHLPYLESMWLREHVSTCARVLRNITIPATTRLQFLSGGISGGTDASDLLTEIRRHTRSSSASPLQTLKIQSMGDPREYLMMTLYTQTELPELFGNEHSQISINSHPSSESAARQIVKHFLKAVPTGNILSLDGRMGPSIQPKTWVTIIKELPNLQSISVFADATTTHLCAAIRLLSASGGTGRVPSTLRRIQISIQCNSERERQNAEIRAAVESLKAMLAELYARGCPLRELQLDQLRGVFFPLSRAEWEELCGMVGTLIRDGQPWDALAEKRKLARLVAEREKFMAELDREIAAGDFEDDSP